MRAVAWQIDRLSDPVRAGPTGQEGEARIRGCDITVPRQNVGVAGTDGGALLLPGWISRLALPLPPVDE